MGRGPGIRAASSSSIQIDFVWNGQRYRERIRLAPTKPNLKYAERLKATIDHEIAKGVFDYGKHFPNSPRAHVAGPGIRLSDALDAYCKSLVGQLEPETVDEYKKDARIFVDGVGDCQLAALTRTRIREWVTESNLSKKRLDNILIPVRGCLKQAVEDGVLETYPLAGFQIRRVSAPKKEQIDPFSPQEIAALGKASLGYLWQFWAWSGLRSGEMIGLRWGDVRADGAAIHVRRAVRVGREKGPKTKQGARDMPLLPAAKAALAGLQRGQDGDSVFTNPNTGAYWYEDRALARAFRKDCQSVGVRYRYPYQLRHTFATWALSSGENPAWIAHYMGHRDTMMLFQVYGKWMPALDPQAGSRMVSKAA